MVPARNKKSAYIPIKNWFDACVLTFHAPASYVIGVSFKLAFLTHTLATLRCKNAIERLT